MMSGKAEPELIHRVREACADSCEMTTQVLVAAGCPLGARSDAYLDSFRTAWTALLASRDRFASECQSLQAELQEVHVAHERQRAAHEKLRTAHEEQRTAHEEQRAAHEEQRTAHEKEHAAREKAHGTREEASSNELKRLQQKVRDQSKELAEKDTRILSLEKHLLREEDSYQKRQWTLESDIRQAIEEKAEVRHELERLVEDERRRRLQLESELSELRRRADRSFSGSFSGSGGFGSSPPGTVGPTTGAIGLATAAAARRTVQQSGDVEGYRHRMSGLDSPAFSPSPGSTGCGGLRSSPRSDVSPRASWSSMLPMASSMLPMVSKRGSVMDLSEPDPQELLQAEVDALDQRGAERWDQLVDLERSGRNAWQEMKWARNHTMLHWAAKNNKPMLCRMLLELRATATLTAKDDDFKTPLDYAEASRSAEALAVLQAVVTGKADWPPLALPRRGSRPAAISAPALSTPTFPEQFAREPATAAPAFFH